MIKIIKNIYKFKINLLLSFKLIFFNFNELDNWVESRIRGSSFDACIVTLLT